MKQRRLVHRGDAGFGIDQCTLPAGYRGVEHRHRSDHLSLFVAGRYGGVCNGDYREARSGGFHFYPAETSHAGVIGPRPVEAIYLDLGRRALSQREQSTLLRWGDVPWQHLSDVSFALRCVHIAAVRGEGCDSIAADLRSAIELATAVQLENAEPSWMQDARSWLEHDRGPGNTLSRCAASMGLSRAHLAAEFKSHTGMTVGAFASRARTHSGVRALLSSDEPVTQIAHRIGFADASHFGRVFRRLLGITPADYRASALGGSQDRPKG